MKATMRSEILTHLIIVHSVHVVVGKQSVLTGWTNRGTLSTQRSQQTNKWICALMKPLTLRYHKAIFILLTRVFYYDHLPAFYLEHLSVLP